MEEYIYVRKMVKSMRWSAFLKSEQEQNDADREEHCFVDLKGVCPYLVNFVESFEDVLLLLLLLLFEFFML
jgi:hypothetical protein